MKSINTLLNIENILSFFIWGIDLSDFGLPGLQIVILPVYQGLLEGVSYLLQFLALIKFFPIWTEHVLDSLHVDVESSFDLLRPDDLVRYVWEAPDSIQHCGLVLLLILIVEELVPQNLDIFLDLDQKLDLILLDSSADSWSGEESVEDLESTEHFIGILC